MTKAEFNTKYGRIAMPTPFAEGVGGECDAIGATSSDAVFNFHKGFPSVYEAPRSNGGRFVKRKEINTLGKLATHNDFYYHSGGLNEFDVLFAESIEGYPEGAVLDYLAGNKIFKIISLKDNNLSNPYGIAGSHGVVAGLVDGIWWKYLNQDNADGTEIFVGSFERMPVTSQLEWETPENIVYSCEFFEMITGFVVPKAGILYAKNIVYGHKVASSYPFTGDGWVYNLAMGDGVVFKDLGENPESLVNIQEPTVESSNGWNLLGGFGQGVSGDHVDVDITNNWAAKTSIPLVATGHYVVIGLFVGCAGYRNNSSNGHISTTTVGSGEDNSSPITFDLWIR